ncbi:MAG TPA: hypothetical protein DCY42_01990 [Chloroflexi bacterium]|nr:hypothetical protein [Chloroflexota bacterium]
MRDKGFSPITLIWWVVVVGLLAACQPAQVAPPTLTSTLPVPTATATFTPTTVWFPPTSTPTLRPTQPQTPTPNAKPGIGALLYQDDFSDPDVWTTYEIVNSKVTISNNDITLALNQPEGLIYGFRPEPQLIDFYAELTASPNYCQAEDEYGLMVRVSGTRLSHYRFVLTCDGRVSVIRVVNNRGNVIMDWQSHPLIPAAFPRSIRLGIWAQGAELRFFINDFLLFSVTDTIIPQGTLGVFVRASGSSPISVNFSDLEVYELGEAAE